jgi:hypothetical protein
MMRQKTCPKHVELYSKNRFEKLVRLVGFILRISSLQRQTFISLLSATAQLGHSNYTPFRIIQRDVDPQDDVRQEV